MKFWTILVLLLVTSAVLAAAVITDGHPVDCPTVAELRDYRPPQASRILAADGSVVADLSPQRRIVVSLGDVPALVRDGFVAVEDRRFWSHAGVDLRGVARAAWRDLTSL